MLNVEKVFTILKPNLFSIALFLFFTFVCIGGVIQSYAFLDIVPKPPLYYI